MRKRTLRPRARMLAGAAVALAATLLPLQPAGASTDNTPTPYLKCMGWLDRDDAHNFRLCFYREMSAVMQPAVNAHNSVLQQEQRLVALPRAAGHANAFEAESCQRTQEISRAITQAASGAVEARGYLARISGHLRTMKGQITQHSSFRMKNRAMMRDEINRVADDNLGRLETGNAKMVNAEARLRAMRVMDRCRERRPDPPGVTSGYEENVVYRGPELRPAFRTESLNACHWYCSNDTKCSAFTYLDPAKRHGPGTCQMFRAVQSSFRDPCCTSKRVR